MMRSLLSVCAGAAVLFGSSAALAQDGPPPSRPVDIPEAWHGVVDQSNLVLDGLIDRTLIQATPDLAQAASDGLFRDWGHPGVNFFHQNSLIVTIMPEISARATDPEHANWIMRDALIFFIAAGGIQPAAGLDQTAMFAIELAATLRLVSKPDDDEAAAVFADLVAKFGPSHPLNGKPSLIEFLANPGSLLVRTAYFQGVHQALGGGDFGFGADMRSRLINNGNREFALCMKRAWKKCKKLIVPKAVKACLAARAAWCAYKAYGDDAVAEVAR